MKPRELEQKISELLSASMQDADLRGALEQLAQSEMAFGGFTPLWGPELYQRNRVLFRPFILSHFSEIMVLPKWKVVRTKWSGTTGKRLDAWLRSVDEADDVLLFRRLYDWRLRERFASAFRDKRSSEIRSELLKRFRSARDRPARQVVLEKFGLWFQLDEPVACRLYQIDPATSGPFILRHLPGGLWGENKRKIWGELLRMAEAGGDEKLRWELYRLQVPVPQWERDCTELSRSIADASLLCAELRKRLPKGWGLNLASGFHALLRDRGRDVVPFVMPQMQRVSRGLFGRGKYGAIVQLCKERGWWDLWAATLRAAGSGKEWNAAVLEVVRDTSLIERTKRDWLLLLSGVGGEWNFGPFSFAQAHALSEDAAVELYRFSPDLTRSRFKVHLQRMGWGDSYAKLITVAMEAGDASLLDYLASRLTTRVVSTFQRGSLAEVERMADYYLSLKRSDETEFSRRAVSVLGQIPAYAIRSYNYLIRTNRLARLLFERSATSLLADPDAMADLVEASEIHVQALAYRTLGLDHPAARQQAARHLFLLSGTLLRPLHRETRKLAFRALANAASTPEDAEMVLRRAREAMRLPDKKYPKEQLLGLIGEVLHRWPELQSSVEQPVIYRRRAA